MNPMLMNLFSSRLGPIRQMMNTIRMAQNPMAGLQEMAKTNPLARQAVQVISQNGGNEEAAFKNTLRGTGLDSQQIFSMINNGI